MNITDIIECSNQLLSLYGKRKKMRENFSQLNTDKTVKKIIVKQKF